jgi:ABC-type branched-subunit amino acid transport system ATPase component
LGATSALEIRELRGGYQPRSPVLKGVSLEAHDDEICVVIGPNGAGKSTLLKALYGQLQWTEGTIRFRSMDLMHLSPVQLTDAGIAYVPQERNVFAGLSVEENLQLACTATGKARRNKVRESLNQHPVLRAKAKARAGSLSGGQRQILALAMALINDPQLLLLDETTAGLSPAARANVFAQIRQLAGDRRCIVIVEQNAFEALSVGDRGYVLVDGHTALSGPADQMLQDPAVRKSFLGVID